MPLTDLPRTPSKTLVFNLNDVDYIAQNNDTFRTKELQIDLTSLAGARAVYFNLNRRHNGPRPPELMKVLMGMINIMSFGGYMATSDVITMLGKPNVLVGEYFYWVGGFTSTDTALNPNNPYDSNWTNSIVTPDGDILMDGKLGDNSSLVPMVTYGAIAVNTKLLISMASQENDTLLDPFSIGDHTLEITGVF